MAALLQPMDQVVLQMIKLSYGKILLQTLIEENCSLSILEKLKNITIKDVIYWVAESWNSTSTHLLEILGEGLAQPHIFGTITYISR